VKNLKEKNKTNVMIDVTGKVLRVLEAEDADGDYLVIRFPDFGDEAQTLVSINQTKFGPRFAAASIILQEKLDRDYVSL
jgi:hypothetical protein